jgi:hypothetical protein
VWDGTLRLGLAKDQGGCGREFSSRDLKKDFGKSSRLGATLPGTVYPVHPACATKSARRTKSGGQLVLDHAPGVIEG